MPLRLLRFCLPIAALLRGVSYAAWLAGAATVSAEPVRATVADAQGRPLPDAVVSVHVNGAPAAAPKGTTAEMGQRNRAFTPTVLAIQTGTMVSFPNFDTVRHHVYSFSPIKPFELKLYAGVPQAPVAFDKPGTAVLGCNIHDRMAGWVHVVGTPYFAKTDSAGNVVLDVPAGDHRMQIWHRRLQDPDTPVERGLQVTAGMAPLQLQLDVAAGP